VKIIEQRVSVDFDLSVCARSLYPLVRQQCSVCHKWFWSNSDHGKTVICPNCGDETKFVNPGSDDTEQIELFYQSKCYGVVGIHIQRIGATYTAYLTAGGKFLRHGALDPAERSIVTTKISKAINQNFFTYDPLKVEGPVPKP